MNDWVENLESTIFSLIKSKTYDVLADKYPDINYSTEESTTAVTKFPNIYFRLIAMSEEGGDLENKTINAVLASVQVDVTANTKKSDAKAVIYAIIGALKELGFSMTALPIFSKEDDVHRAIVRARRMIGSGDTL